MCQASSSWMAGWSRCILLLAGIRSTARPLGCKWQASCCQHQQHLSVAAPRCMHHRSITSCILGCQLYSPLLAVLQQQRHRLPCSAACCCHEGAGAAAVRLAAAAAALGGQVLHHCRTVVLGSQQQCCHSSGTGCCWVGSGSA